MNILLLNPKGRVELLSLFKEVAHHYDSRIFVACHDLWDPAVLTHEGDSIQIRRPLDHLELLDICIKYKIDLIIPWLNVDIQVLSMYKFDFVNMGIRLAIGLSDLVQASLNKIETAELLNKNDIKVLPLLHPDTITKYPVVVKPAYGSGAVGVSIVKNEVELLNKLDQINYPVVQEYLPGDEFTVDAFCAPAGSMIGAIPRKRIKSRSGEVIISQTVHRRDLIALASRVCTVFKFEGAVNIQFIEDSNGVPWCTDVNPRMSGGLPISIRAGLNTPSLILEYFGLQTLPTVDTDSFIWNLVGARWLNTVYKQGESELNTQKYSDSNFIPFSLKDIM